MAITWTAKLKDINGIEQILWSVKDSSKTLGIRGTHPINDDEAPTEPIVDWLKAKFGSAACTEYEEEAAEIDDTPPIPPPE